MPPNNTHTSAILLFLAGLCMTVESLLWLSWRQLGLNSFAHFFALHFCLQITTPLVSPDLWYSQSRRQSAAVCYIPALYPHTHLRSCSFPSVYILYKPAHVHLLPARWIIEPTFCLFSAPFDSFARSYPSPAASLCLLHHHSAQPVSHVFVSQVLFDWAVAMGPLGNRFLEPVAGVWHLCWKQIKQSCADIHLWLIEWVSIWLVHKRTISCWLRSLTWNNEHAEYYKSDGNTGYSFL